MDFGRVSGQVRDFVMNQFEKGVGHLISETSIKFVMWSQLPLVLCSLTSRQLDLAVNFMRGALAQFEATKDSTRHT